MGKLASQKLRENREQQQLPYGTDVRITSTSSTMPGTEEESETPRSCPMTTETIWTIPYKGVFVCSGQRYDLLQSNHGTTYPLAPDLLLVLSVVPETLYKASGLGEERQLNMYLLTFGSGDKDGMLYYFQVLANS